MSHAKYLGLKIDNHLSYHRFSTILQPLLMRSKEARQAKKDVCPLSDDEIGPRYCAAYLHMQPEAYAGESGGTAWSRTSKSRRFRLHWSRRCDSCGKMSCPNGNKDEVYTCEAGGGELTSLHFPD